MRTYGALLTTLIFISIGCSTAPKMKPTLNLNREFLLPTGTYHHNVQLILNINQPGQTKNFRMIGLVRKDEEQISTIALSPLGFTLFKVTDHLKTGEISYEIFIEQIKKHESKIQAYYLILKKLLTLKTLPEADPTLHWDQRSAEGLPEQVSIKNSPDEKPSTFHLSKYDPNHIPLQITIEDPNFKVEVEVSSYEI